MYASGPTPWGPSCLVAAGSLDNACPRPPPRITQLIGSGQDLYGQIHILERERGPNAFQEEQCIQVGAPRILVPAPSSLLPEPILNPLGESMPRRAARTARPAGRESQRALPPQPSHRNVAEASAGKSHRSFLPLFRSRKRADRKGL